MNSYNGFTPAQRSAAFRVTVGAWERGELPRPTTCEACGSEHHVQSHDEDYTNPLGYYSVCFVCHMMIHCRFKSPARWTQYLYELTWGSIFTPAEGWVDFKARYLEGPIADQISDITAPRPPSFMHYLPTHDYARVPPALPLPVRLQ